MIETAIQWLVNFVHTLGYPGIFIMTALESTFLPIPSEVTMIPAGHLIHEGHMNFWGVFAMSVTGTLSGSLLNYWIAKHYGRRFLMRYGKYFLFPPEKMEILEHYFRKHGEVSIFTGRLIPGLRHFISFPAGLAHMDLKKFCFYTGFGGGIWMLTLIGLGYVISDNTDMVHRFLPQVTYMSLGVVLLLVLLYVRKHKKVKG